MNNCFLSAVNKDFLFIPGTILLCIYTNYVHSQSEYCIDLIDQFLFDLWCMNHLFIHFKLGRPCNVLVLSNSFPVS